MQFIRTQAFDGLHQLHMRLTAELLARQKVLWLISGGSNIPITVAAMNQISDELTQRLTILPMDERYGPVGHADSNVRQLYEAGFNPKRATFLPILTGQSLAQTTTAFKRHIISQLGDFRDENIVVIGQFGIGADGHTAGILPKSPATAESTAFAVSYKALDYTRITLTFPALRRIHTSFAFAYGPDKHHALMQLEHGGTTLFATPASILQEIGESYVYNDIYNDPVEEEGANS